jgi:hypothetical protein
MEERAQRPKLLLLHHHLLRTESVPPGAAFPPWEV